RKAAAERRAAALERERLLERERSAREAAEKASQAKDEFLAMVSHELRTPLTAIVGWCRILAEHGKEAPALKRGLQGIGRNARLQSKLISDILDVSRIVSGKLHLELQETDLVTLVDDALESVRPAAEAKKIEVSCSFNSAIAPTWGDPARLQQCIWN